ncbi:hypothetical protein CBS147337_10090 [Penicillium roqueforti]|nr:hypothetical protein CBS147337_10090 [Penicillium roqueforti]
MNEAKQALADCPAYHRVPLHFRVAPGVNIAATSSNPNSTVADGMEASIHAPERQQEEESSLNNQAMIDLETAPVEIDMTPNEDGSTKERLQVASQKAIQDQTNSKRRRTAEPGETMDEQPDDNKWFNIQLTPADFPQANTQQGSHEDQLSQFISQVTTVDDAGNSPGFDGEGLDPESSEYRKMVILKYKHQQVIPIGSSPPAFTTDAPTIEDPNHEIWHEASERSDDVQTHQ